MCAQTAKELSTIATQKCAPTVGRSSDPTRHILIVGDNKQLWSDMKGFASAGPPYPDHLDCVVTSPPYQKDMGFSWDNINTLAEALNDWLHGPAWINFGDMAGDASMRKAPMVAMDFQENGFVWQQTIIWVKYLYPLGGQHRPIGGKKRFNSTHEYIYLMVPSHWRKNFALDRLAVGVPYMDKANIERFGAEELRCPGTVWFIPYEPVRSKAQKLHSHRFPLELPRKCIRASGLKPGSWVLDPYVGAGTTMLAARACGCNSIGYETDEEMVDIIVKRFGTKKDYTLEVIYA